jgi:hypothetical protein
MVAASGIGFVRHEGEIRSIEADAGAHPCRIAASRATWSLHWFRKPRSVKVRGKAEFGFSGAVEKEVIVEISGGGRIPEACC